MSEYFSLSHSARQSTVPSTFNAQKKLAPLGLILATGCCLLAASLCAQTPTPVTVPTWRYDLTHAGQNTGETALTPANVNVNTFGKLFSLSVDSTMYAQPLYMPGVKMSDGLIHNVIFLSTEN